MEPRKWTAYLKLEGETAVHRGEEIVAEFETFIQTIRGVLSSCNVVVFLEPQKETVSHNAEVHERNKTGRSVNA